MTAHILLGQTLCFDGDPLIAGPDAAQINASGGVLIRDGRIAAVGDGADLRAAHPEVPVTDYGADLILPGLVDAHVHYPQTAIIASWGKRLIDWLNSYTFPEEMRLSDAG
ncbi:MAG: guanine deaminase, partial [Pseudomonadota bacterium]